MSKLKITLDYNGTKTTIHCNRNEKIRNIMKRYGDKVEIDINKVYLLYNGKKVNEELSFEELANKEDKMMNIIINEINNENKMNKGNENFIIGEIEITEKDINKEIRIINSFEELKRELHLKNKENDLEYENEKEIKENCLIEINNKIIPFSYFYKFKEKGKYIIKYSFKNKITKTDYMFYSCGSYKIKYSFGPVIHKSLTNLDLSNFNTQNVNNMSYMFSHCESLTYIDLSNFKTENVTYMSGMFSHCESLTYIDLSNFKTENVTNMSRMFECCGSLLI